MAHVMQSHLPGRATLIRLLAEQVVRDIRAEVAAVAANGPPSDNLPPTNTEKR